MLLRRFTKRFDAIGRRSLAGVLLLHLLAAVVLSVAPDLHALIHEHAHDEGHECAITLFRGEKVVMADPIPLHEAGVTWAETGLPRVFIPRVKSLEIRESAPGRAPPAAVI